jgi:hypothetical protein
MIGIINFSAQKPEFVQIFKEAVVQGKHRQALEALTPRLPEIPLTAEQFVKAAIHHFEHSNTPVPPSLFYLEDKLQMVSS